MNQAGCLIKSEFVKVRELSKSAVDHGAVSIFSLSVSVPTAR